jgi:hypothetical protein
LSTEDEERSGRATQVRIPANMGAIHSTILGDRRISAKKIVETLAIFRERVSCIIHVILNMRKLSTKFVPKYLDADQKRDGVLASQAILDRFRKNPVGFLNRLATVDGTWIHIYDPESKEQSKEWRHSGSPLPKEFKTQKLSSKLLTSVFWDKDGILLVDYLENSEKINGKLLCCTSRRTEAATSLETSRRIFEKSTVSSRQCCFPQGSCCSPEIGRSSL